MARTKKRRATRRKNPRTTAAYVVNPRRRKSTRKVNSRRRRKPTRRKATRRRKSNGRKRNFARLRRPVRRFARPLRRRIARRPRKGTAAYRRDKRMLARRKSNGRRRRNPSMTTQLKSGVNKIPVIGGLLSNMVDFLGPALFGAVGVEPTMMVAKFLGPYVPQFNAAGFYALSGVFLAALVNKFAPVNPALRSKLAVAIAAASGGVAYYKWRTEGDQDMAGELGTLEGLGNVQLAPGIELMSGYGNVQLAPGIELMSGAQGYGSQLQIYAGQHGYGDGGAYAVVPFGDAGGSYGALEVSLYSDALAGDAYDCPDDVDFGELQIALAGAHAWGRAFPRARFARRTASAGGRRGTKKSEHAGQKGHRWGWLIRMIGFPKFQAIMKLPTTQRRAYLAQLRDYAKKQADIATVTENAEAASITASTANDMSGWAGFMYGA